MMVNLPLGVILKTIPRPFEPPFFRHAVEVAAVRDQRSMGIAAIRLAREGMEDGFLSRRCHFEDRSVAVRAAAGVVVP